MSEKSSCPNCDSTAIEQITSGYRVAKVVGVTLDNGLVCDLVTFVPNTDENAVYYRCKHCLAVLPFDSTEALVEYLRKE